MIDFEDLEEFARDVKRLAKKYRTIHEDLVVVKKVLNIKPEANPPFSQRIEGLGVESCIIKVRKIASKSFKGKGVQSGFRLVYAYYKEEKRIVFIELYHKSEKALEDRVRIKKYFK